MPQRRVHGLHLPAGVRSIPSIEFAHLCSLHYNRVSLTDCRKKLSSLLTIEISFLVKDSRKSFLLRTGACADVDIGSTNYPVCINQTSVDTARRKPVVQLPSYETTPYPPM